MYVCGWMIASTHFSRNQKKAENACDPDLEVIVVGDDDEGADRTFVIRWEGCRTFPPCIFSAQRQHQDEAFRKRCI